MKTIQMTIDPTLPNTLAAGRMDATRLDATSEKDIALQIAVDDAEAMQDDAKALFKVLDKAPEAALMALH